MVVRTLILDGYPHDARHTRRLQRASQVTIYVFNPALITGQLGGVTAYVVMNA